MEYSLRNEAFSVVDYPCVAAFCVALLPAAREAAAKMADFMCGNSSTQHVGSNFHSQFHFYLLESIPSLF